jgi:diadenosine tetraphosphate (Ap4A) HIT family hydrolase
MLNKYNVRNDEQMKRMEKAEANKICPFCPKGLKIIHKLPIEKTFGNFFATKTAFPYDGVQQHYLIISKKHLDDPAKLKSADWQDIGKCFNWVLKKTRITGGAMFWRFGDMQKNGSSIGHFHIQVLSGNSSEREPEDKRESIKVKLGYKKK